MLHAAWTFSRTWSLGHAEAYDHGMKVVLTPGRSVLLVALHHAYAAANDGDVDGDSSIDAWAIRGVPSEIIEEEVDVEAKDESESELGRNMVPRHHLLCPKFPNSPSGEFQATPRTCHPHLHPLHPPLLLTLTLDPAPLLGLLPADHWHKSLSLLAPPAQRASLYSVPPLKKKKQALNCECMRKLRT